MATLYNNIAALCESRGIKGGKMCTDLGISKGLLTDLKNGRRSGVSAVTAQKIAAYFGVSVGYLLGEDEGADKKEKPTAQSDGLSDEKRKLIEKIMTLPDDQVQLLLQVAERIG